MRMERVALCIHYQLEKFEVQTRKKLKERMAERDAREEERGRRREEQELVRREVEEDETRDPGRWRRFKDWGVGLGK